MAILTAVKIDAPAQVEGLGQAAETRSPDSADAKAENGAAPVPAGQRDRRFAPSTRTYCPARGPARDTAEPVFGYLDKAVASGTRVGYSLGWGALS